MVIQYEVKTGQYKEVWRGEEGSLSRIFMCDKESRNLELKTSESTVYFETIYLNTTKREQLDRKEYPHSQYLEHHPLLFCDEKEGTLSIHLDSLHINKSTYTSILLYRSERNI